VPADGRSDKHDPDRTLDTVNTPSCCVPKNGSPLLVAPSAAQMDDQSLNLSALRIPRMEMRLFNQAQSYEKVVGTSEYPRDC